MQIRNGKNTHIAPPLHNFLKSEQTIKDLTVRKDLINLSDARCETNYCISCNVSNCVYHAANNTCSAGKIQVGNGTANRAEDTCCDTFKAK